jgi:hypothetical protein
MTDHGDSGLMAADRKTTTHDHLAAEETTPA